MRPKETIRALVSRLETIPSDRWTQIADPIPTRDGDFFSTCVGDDTVAVGFRSSLHDSFHSGQVVIEVNNQTLYSAGLGFFIPPLFSWSLLSKVFSLFQRIENDFERSAPESALEAAERIIDRKCT